MTPLQEEIRTYLVKILGKPALTQEELERDIKSFSAIDEARVKYKVTDEFLKILHRMTLEELVLLKLEYTARRTKTMVPLKMFRIVQRAMEFVIVKYALSCHGTLDEVCAYLGLKQKELSQVKDEILRVQIGAGKE